MEANGLTSEEEYVSRAGTGALLNPRLDPTFKALFTQPTPESRAALHSFLEAATERTIVHFEFHSSEAPAGFSGQRAVSYDISCEFNDGLSADIEMQAFNQKYDYGKRAEYQVARLETTYLQKGDGWERAPTVYQISVLDFNYAPRGSEGGGGGTGPVSRYAMRTKDGRELSNALNVIFVELPKAVALEGSVGTNSALENWAIFLKDADDPGKAGVIQELTSREAGLMQAQKSLSSISASRDLWLAQYHQELHERDRISSMRAALREGMEKGLREGREKGMKEGREAGMKEGIREGQRKSAVSMLSDGVPAAQVAKWTGLPLEEIERL